MNKPPRIAASHRLDLANRPRRNRKAEWRGGSPERPCCPRTI